MLMIWEILFSMAMVCCIQQNWENRYFLLDKLLFLTLFFFPCGKESFIRNFATSFFNDPIIYHLLCVRFKIIGLNLNRYYYFKRTLPEFISC